jgi:heme iron utilization protein
MTLAANARSLVVSEGYGSLATLAEDGTPFGSLVAYATTAEGAIVVLLSKLAEHTKNLVRDGRGSLLVTARTSDPMASARTTLMGRFVLATLAERDSVVETYLAKHPSGARYAGFADFAPWVLVPTRIRTIEGFGAMGFLEPAEWVAAFRDARLPRPAATAFP